MQDRLEDIRKRRMALGLTTKELAKEVGKSQSLISRIEMGKTKPSFELAQKLFALLHKKEIEAGTRIPAKSVMNPNVKCVSGDMTIREVIELMEETSFSQFPVLEKGIVVGSISEATLLKHIVERRGERRLIREIKEPIFPHVPPEFPVELLLDILKRYSAVLVLEDGELKGIITKMDVLKKLRV